MKYSKIILRKRPLRIIVKGHNLIKASNLYLNILRIKISSRRKGLKISCLIRTPTIQITCPLTSLTKTKATPTWTPKRTWWPRPPPSKPLTFSSRIIIRSAHFELLVSRHETLKSSKGKKITTSPSAATTNASAPQATRKLYFTTHSSPSSQRRTWWSFPTTWTSKMTNTKTTNISTMNYWISNRKTAK